MGEVEKKAGKKWGKAFVFQKEEVNTASKIERRNTLKKLWFY